MSIYSGPVFDMAARQFEKVADHLDMPVSERARLLYPKRTLAVSVPSTATTARPRCSRVFGCSTT